MGFNQNTLGKWGLGGGQIPLAGQNILSGQSPLDAFQERLNIYRGLSKEEQEKIGANLFQNLAPTADESLIRGLVEESRRRGSKEYQREMLELADEFQTRKGMRQTAFNLFGSGMDNLMKGIGMSMNPYGTPEGLQNYLALTVAGPQAMSEGYRNVRTPMAIPAVQAPGAPTYF
jgi:hypothetical protein